MPVVSIIMPSLNVVSYIEECLQSAINQTLKDIEIICIDAGSTDGTREIINKYVLADSRIKVIDSKIKSYGYQVNLGIHEATGEYIGILETDDFVDSEMYEQLYNIAVKHDADYVRADYDEIFEANGKRIYNTQHIFNDIGNYNVETIAGHIPEVFVKDLNLWNGIYKKKFLDKYNIRLSETAGAAFQDIGFKLLTLSYAEKIIYINYSGYRYRLEREGCSSCNNNVLKYAWQEFKRLLYETNVPLTDTFKYVIYRMIDVFICEHNKLVLKQSVEKQPDFNEKFIEPYYIWFKEEIIGYLNKGVISCDCMNGYQLNNLIPLLDNQIEYNRNIIMQINNKEKSWDKVADLVRTSEAIIVSYGIRGRTALKQLIRRGVNVIAVCDNDETVRNEKIGLPILSVEGAVKNYKNAIYVISNKKYADMLRTQLLNIGISERCIVQVD